MVVLRGTAFFIEGGKIMEVFTEYYYVWIVFALCCLFLISFFGKRIVRVKNSRKQQEAKFEEEKNLFSHLTSSIFDETDTNDLTKAVIFHIQAKEDRLFNNDDYDGNIIPYLTHEELMIYTLYQVENSLQERNGSIHSFFIDEPYCMYRPYYKEAYELMNCHEIAVLLAEAEKLATLIENDQEDDIDENSPYATYNFSDFTNELKALLRSSGLFNKAGEYIRVHKDSFIEKENTHEKTISE